MPPKVVVVYLSISGNTKAMADAIVDGANSKNVLGIIDQEVVPVIHDRALHDLAPCILPLSFAKIL